MHIKNSTLISKTIHVLFTDSYVYCFYQFATFWYIFIIVVFKIATYVVFFFTNKNMEIHRFKWQRHKVLNNYVC